MEHTWSYLHDYSDCSGLNGHKRTHLEAVALLPGLGMEEEDTVHTERHHTAAAVLTSVPDTPPELNMAEEDRKKD